MKFIPYTTVFSDNLSILDKVVIPSADAYSAKIGFISAANKLLKWNGESYGGLYNDADEAALTGDKYSKVLAADIKLAAGTPVPHIVYFISDSDYFKKNEFADLIFESVRPFGAETITPLTKTTSDPDQGEWAEGVRDVIVIGKTAGDLSVPLLYDSRLKSSIKEGKLIDATALTAVITPGVGKFGSDDIKEIYVHVQFVKEDKTLVEYMYPFTVYSRRPNFLSVALNNVKSIGMRVKLYSSIPVSIDNIMLHGTSVTIL